MKSDMFKRVVALKKTEHNIPERYSHKSKSHKYLY